VTFLPLASVPAAVTTPKIDVAGSPLSPLGSWPAAKSLASSVPARTSAPRIELSRMSAPDSALFFTLDAVTAFVATFAPVTAW